MELHAPDVTITAELDRLGDEIAELSAHLDCATARLFDLIREFDARGGWSNGFRSCAAWLSWRVGLAPGAAREHVRVARALGTLPRLSQALARGELSYSKVRELTRVATPETEERLLAVGRAGTAEHVERIVRGWRRMDRKAEEHEAARRHASRSLHVYPDEDGTVRVRGRLTAEMGALLVKALAAAREALYRRRHDQAPEADPPTMEQQQADALELLAEVALRHELDPGAPGRALPGRRPRRCRSPGRRRRAWPIGLRGRRTRSSWNVPAPGVRREPGRHATRRRRTDCRGWRPDAHDPAGSAPGPPLSRRRLPLPGLWRAFWARSPHRSLGARWTHDALESGAAVPPSPSRGPRGRLPGRSRARTASCGSGGRMADRSTMSRRRPRCQRIP